MKNTTIYHKTDIILDLDFEKVTLYSIYSLSILFPLVVGHPQLLVGSTVNFLIVYSTLKYGIKKTLPVLLLPSITATATGVLFGGATYFLLYVMPFIMFSNYILSFFVSKKNILIRSLGIVVKGTFLYAMYSLLNQTVGLPKIFLASIPVQYITATVGFLLAISLFKIENSKS
jgi:hypothetical protein